MSKREKSKEKDKMSVTVPETFVNKKHIPNCFLGRFSSRKDIFKSNGGVYAFTNTSKEPILSRLNYSKLC